MSCWSKTSLTADTRSPRCWRCSAFVGRAACGSAPCSTRPSGGKSSCRSTIGASSSRTNSSSATASTSTNTIETCRSSGSCGRTKLPRLTKLAEQLIQPEILTLLRRHAGNREIWLVGGALRDHFLGRSRPDLDFVVDREAAKLARLLSDDLQAGFHS